MIRKKERIHEAGASNIDFRSIGDKKSVEFFQPWKKTKEFGMMGHSRLELQVKEMQTFLKSSKNILSNKEKNFQSLSPRIYSAVKFYNKNNVPFKKRTYFDSDKLAELEENLKGKEVFIGDSMMIGSNTKRKKAKIVHPETSFPGKKNLKKWLKITEG